MGSTAAQPPFQRSRRVFGSFNMPPAEGIADRPFGAVDADRGITDGKFVPSDVEGLRVEAMPPDRPLDLGLATGPRLRDVDELRDPVGQGRRWRRSDGRDRD